MNETNRKLVSGLVWSFLETIGPQGVSLVITIILARLIVPEAYGVIAAAQVVTSIATTFVTGGFGNALIQKKDADDLDFSSMFIFNTCFSVFVYIIIYFSAPLFVGILNESYDYELLVKVIRVIGIGIIFASFNSFYRSVLTKWLQFKKIFFVTLIGTLISAVVGIAMAYEGFGVWALVSQYMVLYIFNTVLFVIFSQWCPKLMFSFTRLRPLISFGGKLMMSSLLTTVYTNLSSLIIGNQYDSEDLAYYNKGINFPKMIVANIMSAINTALFPIMVTLKGKEEFKNYVKQFNQYSMFIISPMMFGLAAVSTTFVSLLLTDKWLPCVPFLQIACLDYAIQPIGIANLQYWKASGRATLYLVVDIIKKVIGIGFLIVAVTLKKGAVSIALVALISSIIAAIITLYPAKKYIDYSILEQIKDIAPPFILSAIMCLAVTGLGMILNTSLLIKLILQIMLGIVVYVGGCVIFKVKGFWEIIYFVKFKLRKET